MNWNPLLDEICAALNANAGTIPEGIEKEEHFERRFVEPIVRQCLGLASNDVGIATHPWVKPGMTKSEEQKDKIQIWRECKEWANVTAWGMRHTLDIFLRDETAKDDECIAVEVKLCKVSNGKMPTGEFQRMIGQSVLFLGRKNHKAVISVFGFKGDAPGALEDNGMDDFLRSIGVWPVVLNVP